VSVVAIVRSIRLLFDDDRDVLDNWDMFDDRLVLHDLLVSQNLLVLGFLVINGIPMVLWIWLYGLINWDHNRKNDQN